MALLPSNEYLGILSRYEPWRKIAGTANQTLLCRPLLAVLLITSCFFHSRQIDTGHWRIIRHDLSGGTEGEVCSRQLPCFVTLKTFSC